MKKLISISDASKALNCCERHVRDLISKGELPVVRLGKSARSDRVDPEHIDQLIANKTITIGKSWQSTNEEKPTGANFKSVANELENRLGKPRKRKRLSSSAA